MHSWRAAISLAEAVNPKDAASRSPEAVAGYGRLRTCRVPSIAAAVEGLTDEAVVERLIDHAGGKVGTVYGKKGKSHLCQKIAGYNNAALRAPWLVLVDLDADADCAPALV